MTYRWDGEIKRGETFRFITWAWNVDKAQALFDGVEPASLVRVADWKGMCVQEYTTSDGECFESMDEASAHAKTLGSEATVGMPLTGISVDEKRAMGPDIDLSVPVIVVRFPEWMGGCHMVIDGWHRIFRAHKEKIEYLPAHILSPEQEAAVRISPDKRDSARRERTWKREQKEAAS